MIANIFYTSHANSLIKARDMGKELLLVPGWNAASSTLEPVATWKEVNKKKLFFFSFTVFPSHFLSLLIFFHFFFLKKKTQNKNTNKKKKTKKKKQKTKQTNKQIKHLTKRILQAPGASRVRDHAVFNRSYKLFGALVKRVLDSSTIGCQLPKSYLSIHSKHLIQKDQLNTCIQDKPCATNPTSDISGKSIVLSLALYAWHRLHGTGRRSMHRWQTTHQARCWPDIRCIRPVWSLLRCANEREIKLFNFQYDVCSLSSSCINLSFYLCICLLIFLNLNSFYFAG